MEGTMVTGAIIMMLGVTACYTISSLSDKYAVTKAKFKGNEFTFLMCFSLSVFLSITLPFQQLYFSFVPQSFIAIFLIATCKLLEFQMSALVLKEISAFELKAWLGITLFVSYVTDICYGENPSALKLFCIALTAIGLVFIAKAGTSGSTDYRRIIIPLIFYISAKYCYGLVIKAFTPYASPTVQLLTALIIITLIMLFFIKPAEILKKNKNGVLNVVLARIPNTLGMLLENAVIAVSLASYSFIQPMILTVLFFIGLIRKESYSRTNIIGSILCIIGVISFQLL